MRETAMTAFAGVQRRGLVIAQSIARWVLTKAAKRKHFRERVILVDATSKRYVDSTLLLDHIWHYLDSRPPGRILRKDLENAPSNSFCLHYLSGHIGSEWNLWACR